MNRPKENEYWEHKNVDETIFITAVGIKHVLATIRQYDGLHEEKYDIRDLLENYERKESTKS